MLVIYLNSIFAQVTGDHNNQETRDVVYGCLYFALKYVETCDPDNSRSLENMEGKIRWSSKAAKRATFQELGVNHETWRGLHRRIMTRLCETRGARRARKMPRESNMSLKQKALAVYPRDVKSGNGECGPEDQLVGALIIKTMIPAEFRDEVDCLKRIKAYTPRPCHVRSVGELFVGASSLLMVDEEPIDEARLAMWRRRQKLAAV